MACLAIRLIPGVHVSLRVCVTQAFPSSFNSMIFLRELPPLIVATYTPVLYDSVREFQALP